MNPPDRANDAARKLNSLYIESASVPQQLGLHDPSGDKDLFDTRRAGNAVGRSGEYETPQTFAASRLNTKSDHSYLRNHKTEGFREPNARDILTKRIVDYGAMGLHQFQNLN